MQQAELLERQTKLVLHEVIRHISQVINATCPEASGLPPTAHAADMQSLAQTPCCTCPVLFRKNCAEVDDWGQRMLPQGFPCQAGSWYLYAVDR